MDNEEKSGYSRWSQESVASYLPSFMSPSKTNTIKEMSQNIQFHDQLEKTVRPLIDLVDSMRSIEIDKDISLPSIAVVGDQSSGKSSVLEALSGVALPRGSGIVTRCPLELKLRKDRKARWKAVISYRDQTAEFSDPKQVSQYVEKVQNVLAGSGVGISKEMIRLEIWSPDVCDLTLIDLPGIARVPVKDQPEDIAAQIKSLIRSFIERSETIMLVVVACNVDIATTEALQMAQEVDPEGNRTLAILTKPDLIDRGTEGNVLDIVHNKSVPLKMGYVVVKCRGQKQINEGVSIMEALEEERVFFEDHPQFSCLIPQKKATTKYLATNLTQTLVNHIRKSLPQLSDQIHQKLRQVKKDLTQCMGGPPLDPGKRKTFLIKSISDFNEKISILSKGEDTNAQGNIFLFLRQAFNTWFNHLESLKSNYNKDIEEGISEYGKQYRGRELLGFINYTVLENFVKRQVETLEDPAKETLEIIKDEVLKRFTVVSEACFSNYPYLQHTSEMSISEILSSQSETVLERIREQFEMEKQVFTLDAIFERTIQLDGKVKISPMKTIIDVAVGSVYGEQDQAEKYTKHNGSIDLLKSYYQIVLQRLADQIPMLIRHFMLNEASKTICGEMQGLLQRDNSEDFLREESEAGQRRSRLQARAKRLELAQNKLRNFEFSFE